MEPLEALSRLATTVAGASKLPEILDEALDCLERALHADRSAVLLFDPDGVARFKAWRNLSDPYRQKVEGHSPWAPNEANAAPILVSDVRTDAGIEAFRSTILVEGIRSLAFIPIISGRSVLGKFMVYFDEPHAFSEVDVQIARTIAAHIAFGIERTRLHESIAEDPETISSLFKRLGRRKVAERRLSAEHAVTRMLADSNTLAKAVPKILASLGECLGCTFAAYWRAEQEGTRARCAESWQGPAVSLDSFDRLCRSMTLERGTGLPGRVLASGKPAWISDLSKDTNFPRLQEAARVGLRSGFAFPIHTQGRTLAVMEFFLPHAAEPDPDLIEMMSAIGSEIGQFVERTQMEEALAQNQEITRSILNAALDGVITMSQNGVVIGWNREAERMFGWTAEEATGRILHELCIPPRYRKAHQQGLQRFLEKGESAILNRRIEVQGLRRDGSEFPLELTVTAVASADSTIFSAFLRDITERKEAERRLLEENRAKDDFLAMLGHELRNPLNPIRSAVHILGLTGSREPMFDRARGILDRQVRHMTRLIDDLLDVSRISRGKILLRREKVNLLALTEATVEDHRGEIEEYGRALKLELPSEPLWASADPTRLSQIIGNILDNAVKFTDRGDTITVTVTHDSDSSQAILAIRDNGIGMEPAIVERAFDTFAQADRSLDRSSGGLGLGLALVKGLVALHGGSVAASSDGLGKGSLITVRLPLGAPPELEPKHSARNVVAGGTCHVLVIEDHVDSSEGMRLCVALDGHRVDVAHTGSEGVDLAKRLRPDVILCDIGLDGEFDGYAVARTLRANQAFSSTYLVAVTGYGREEDIRASRDAGFDLHLTKPVDPKALQSLLREIGSRLPAIRE